MCCFSALYIFSSIFASLNLFVIVRNTHFLLKVQIFVNNISLKKMQIFVNNTHAKSVFFFHKFIYTKVQVFFLSNI